MSTHTPTATEPYTIRAATSHPPTWHILNARGGWVATVFSQAAAERFVQAVNSHAALVEACKVALAILLAKGGPLAKERDYAIERLQAALAGKE